MKLFKAEQIRELDRYTVGHEGITSLELMERASRAMADWIMKKIPSTCKEKPSKVCIIAGPGNNGGDGLAVARMLSLVGYDVEVFVFAAGHNLSADCQANFDRIKKEERVKTEVDKSVEALNLEGYDYVLDALFGSGLSRTIEGVYADIVDKMNACSKCVVSIDIPSGLNADKYEHAEGQHIVKANYTLSLQQPKLSFLMPETAVFVGEVVTLPIGISEEGMEKAETPFYLTEKSDVDCLSKRNKFAHKGTYGHALMTGGSRGKAGSMYLASKACLRTGAGLLTVLTPEKVQEALQVNLPEAMCLPTNDDEVLSRRSAEYVENRYSAVGIGCGLGTEDKPAEFLREMLENVHVPAVIDADAINILAENRDWVNLIPSGSILTPHPKEWERLSGVSLTNRTKQIDEALDFAYEHKVVVVLKGAYSAVVLPDGSVRFNSTGNPGMATAGSGDTLTGICLSLLAQSYKPSTAAVMGVYLHGLAGDIAAKEKGEYSLIASDIIDALPRALKLSLTDQTDAETR